MSASSRRAAAVAAATALFAGVFALALAVEDAHPSILHLHAVPVAVLALQLGILAALAATACSMSLMMVWADLEGFELVALDYTSGAVPLLIVVLACRLALGRAAPRDPAGSLAAIAGERRPDAGVDELTEREREVLGLLALGYTNREIAEQLVLSVRTVESHRARIQRKLAIRSRSELVRHAVDRGLLRWTPGVPASGP